MCMNVMIKRRGVRDGLGFHGYRKYSHSPQVVLPGPRWEAPTDHNL